MIQDKESLIKRLEFKLNRAQNDQGTNVIQDFNQQIDQSRVDNTLSPTR